MEQDYLAARRQGLAEVRAAEREGRSPYPAVLDEIIKNEGKLAEIPLGLLEIPLDMIDGTKTAGRTSAFADNFMPILDSKSEFASKWSNLYDSQLEDGIHDPIKAYEYMTRFYVEEGNKRVSVSRYVGATAIHANVTRVMPRKTDTKAYRVYREFLEYYNVAHLYDVTFTEEGSYRRFAHLLGQTMDRPWADEVIEEIRAGYAVFCQIYEKEGGRKKTNLPDGDAFLIYLRFYPIQSLNDEPRQILSDRIGRLWNEFRVGAQEDDEKIALVEMPEKLPDEAVSVPAGAFSAEGAKASAPSGGADQGSRDEGRKNASGSGKKSGADSGKSGSEDGKKGGSDAVSTLTNTIRGILGSAMPVSKKKFTKGNPVHMAFIYSKTPEESPWIYGHELGRNYVENHFNGLVKTLRYDSCATNEETRKAIDAAVAADAEVIFTISPTQMDETLRSAIHYPHVKFLNCSINLSQHAVRSYYGRMHEAKFLMGAVAASVASNHKIGYVADYPIYGIVAGINAFAIGASLIDPKAKIILKWSTDRETDWRKDFEEEGVYVISGPDFIKPNQASREYGIYQRDMDGPIYNLAAPVWNWGRYYELIVRNILDGTYDEGEQAQDSRSTNYWWGMSAGVIDVILSEKLSYETKKLVDLLRGGIISGQFSPFTGELHSQTELVRDASSRGLSNAEIITMSWLNDNVIGSLPRKDALTEDAEAAVNVAGVAGVVSEGEKGGAGSEAGSLAAAGAHGEEQI